MTISYPVVAPTDVVQPSDIKFFFGNVIGVGVSPHTLKSQTYDLGGDAWRIEVSFDPLKREEAQPWMAFLASLRGRKGTFLMSIKAMGTPLGAGTGTPAVKGANQTGEVLLTDGWTNSTLVLKRGDLFEIDQRLYMTLTDVTSDGSGNASIDVWPSLRSHADNALINVNNPVGTWKLPENIVDGPSISNAPMYNISFIAEEAVE